MRGRSRNVIVTLAAGGLLAAFNVVPSALPAENLTPADPAVADLVADLDGILADPRLDGAQASVVVADAETGDVLYDHNGENRLMPASNTKLLTSAAAMDVLGPEHTFGTTVETDARHSGRILAGNLYLRGTGDPTMLAEDYENLAGQIADAGIQRVHGAVVADDTWFDDVRLGLGWNWDDEPFYYSAQISALTVGPDTDYDAGTVIVRVEPGRRAGDAPVVTMVPDNDYVGIVNDAVTTDAGSGRSISIDRDHGSDSIRISGTIATDAAPTSVWRAIWEPTGLAADVFLRALEERGVKVRDGIGYGSTPAGARVLAAHESMPLSELLIPFMKLSNNGHAEVLVKAMGREVSGAGTWAAGLAAMRTSLQKWDVDTDTIAVVDGSGLSRRNWVPGNEFVDMLRAIQDEPWFDAWYESMPVAGVSERMVGGTLRSRMVGTAAQDNVRAKTGSLTGASALSGYVTTADDDELVFAIVLNYYLSGKPSDLEDAIAVRLAEHTADGEVPVGTLSDSRENGSSSEQLGEHAPVSANELECSWTKSC
ncbi:D-alanyl-D-alanine carboxypeptidase/D-alanyl-D-alanine endopeptidase [Phytoactinopolyspora alkaliphila]|uniref:D-alanyl-D-alanine carboxypeptidase/D-alanyl-D-alanine endopeptidase n=1 Tax=Phytoactinopolyspora alkaliphila TaxID=1783498 RepID=UPI001C20B56E|nr:D-alanyl-D-alanine carboxypeptidase/D-alanyl-D-alanine-endopeptidase [Phytoactinopolyspora alkaliphila]